MEAVLAAPSGCVGTGIVDPICQGVSGIGSAIFGTGATAALDALSTWVANGSAWLLGQIGSALETSTQISLGSPWFITRYHSMEGLLAIVALPLLLASAIQAIVQQRPSLLARAALVHLPLAMVLAGAAVQLTSMALSVTDQLASAVSATTPGSLQSLTGSLATAIVNAGATTGSAAPAFIAMLGAVVVAVAAMVLWVELVLRAAAIYVAVVFLPLALISMVWPALASWSRRLVETLVALILSKLVIVVVLDMAVDALGTTQGRGFSTIVTGIALLTLAAMAPFTVLKLLPMFEATAGLHLEGLRQRGAGSMMHGTPRSAVDLALERSRMTPPLAVPAALVAASSAGRAGASTRLGSDPVGEQSSEDPLEQSAFAANEPASDPPIRPSATRDPAASPATASESRRPVVWPGATLTAPTAATREEAAPSRPPPPRPTLVIERDQYGPLIRMRDPGEDAERDG